MNIKPIKFSNTIPATVVSLCAGVSILCSGIVIGSYLKNLEMSELLVENDTMAEEILCLKKQESVLKGQIDSLLTFIESRKPDTKHTPSRIERKKEGKKESIVIKRDTTGVRNKNPANIVAMSSKNPWMGQIGKDKRNHAVFSSFEHGVRAHYLTLKKYVEKHGVDTLYKITSRFCEGDAVRYANFIGSQIGVSNIHAKVDIMGHMPRIMKAMVRWENGWDVLPDSYYEPYSYNTRSAS